MGDVCSCLCSSWGTITTIFTGCWGFTSGHANFIWKLEENLGGLESELEQLKEHMNDMTRRVRVAEEQQQLTRLDQVQGWLTRTQTMINEAELLIQEGPQQISILCTWGFCSIHPCSSYNFGKKIAEKLQNVRDQRSSGVFNTVADRAPLLSVTIQPNEPTVGLESTFDKVQRSLQEKEVGIIGLYGQGGVGKTTLLNQINNNFLPNDFDYVIRVVASQHMQIEKVQQDIGKKIGFSDDAWKHKSPDEKAIDIFGVLCTKKFALLLDDIWQWIDLTKLGVPLPTQENGSKIIFATRSFDVCNQMRAHKKTKVECLPQREAWELFEKMVGAEILSGHVEIRTLAKVVAEECAGLPLALVIIGRAMASKKTPEAWKYVINRLRESTASIFPEVGKEMYPTLQCSYDCLPDEMVKSCFLYCSIYPEDFLISRHELIDCWIGEGLLDEHTNYYEARNQGDYIIGSLVDACLLEEEENGDVKMHDVIRDMALWIAGEQVFVKAGMKLKEQPKAEKSKNLRRMSLMENEIGSLTEMLVCPNLQTLFLGKNELKVVTDDFFNSMPMLRVLDLSYNFGLTESPTGIAKLASVQHLNLSHTNIRELPVELNALEKLKYLNLEYTRELEMIPHQLISGFSNLQVLKMKGCECDWPVEEMNDLNHLEVLTITFKSASMLDRALNSDKFQICNVEAVVLQDFFSSRLLNILGLANMQHLHALYIYDCLRLEEVKMEDAGIASARCFHSLRTIHLISCPKLRNVNWVIFASHLKTLLIDSCLHLEELIGEENLDEPMGNSNLFSKLEVLQLGGLPKLTTIYRAALPFPQLKEIKINTCRRLKKLPLNSDNTKGRKLLIEGEKKWWENLEWEDEATRTAFLPFFQPMRPFSTIGK